MADNKDSLTTDEDQTVKGSLVVAYPTVTEQAEMVGATK